MQLRLLEESLVTIGRLLLAIEFVEDVLVGEQQFPVVVSEDVERDAGSQAQSDEVASG